MSHISAIASLVILSTCSGNAPVTGVVQVKPLTAENARAQTLLANNTVSPSLPDGTLKSAVDILNEAKKALKINDRRQQMKPGIQDRVVEKEKKKRDKVLIMGGAEAFPM